MKCPGCREEIYDEELINGNCPLCGESIEEQEPETTDYETIDKIVSFFESESETMAVNIDQSQKTREREFNLHVTPSFIDKIKPKKCDACGRWHIKFGDKEYKVSLKGDEGKLKIRYYCRLCECVE